MTKIEKWIRSIVAEEVGRIDADLQRERQELRTLLEMFREGVARLPEVQENAQLRATLDQMNRQVASVASIIHELHPEVQNG